jgi:hypothetical protein
VKASKETSARSLYYFERGSLLDLANRLPETQELRTDSFERADTPKHEQSFRVVLDPHGKKMLSNGSKWNAGIYDFTLNNNYVMFLSRRSLWQVEISKLEDGTKLMTKFPKPFLDLTGLEEDKTVVQKIFPGTS